MFTSMFKFKARRHQSGSSAVFFAFFMPVMLMMIVLVADIGQLVFERIRLQQVVDASALAAANIQSIGMNEIADLNNDAQIEYDKLVAILSLGVWETSQQADAVVDFYAEVFDAIHSYQEEANEHFAQLAKQYAQDYVDVNLPGAELFVISGSSEDRLIEYEVESMTLNWLYYDDNGCSGYCETLVWTWTDPDDPSTSGAHFGATPSIADKVVPIPGTADQDVLWIKRTPPVTYAAYGLRQKRKGFLLGKDLFKKLIPEMVAYSSAKPTEGHIYDMDPSYRPILKHLQRHSPDPSVPSLDKMEH